MAARLRLGWRWRRLSCTTVVPLSGLQWRGTRSQLGQLGQLSQSDLARFVLGSRCTGGNLRWNAAWGLLCLGRQPTLSAASGPGAGPASAARGSQSRSPSGPCQWAAAGSGDRPPVASRFGGPRDKLDMAEIDRTQLRVLRGVLFGELAQFHNPH